MRREQLDRWLREHPRALDAFLVLTLLIFPGLATLAAGSRVAQSWQSTLATVVLLTLPLAWRRTHPAASTAIVYGAAFAHFVGGTTLLPSDLTVFVALYSAAAYGTRRGACSASGSRSRARRW